jgi:uncharacterized protein (DUF433 family)
MDWTGCEWIVQVPGRLSGAPVVLGSRVPPEVIVEHADGCFTVG